MRTPLFIAIENAHLDIALDIVKRLKRKIQSENDALLFEAEQCNPDIHTFLRSLDVVLHHFIGIDKQTVIQTLLFY